MSIYDIFLFSKFRAKKFLFKHFFYILHCMSQTKKHLHVIGIGGIGVSALARYYKRLGYSVSGSDGADSPFLDRLRSEGFEIFIGHQAENL